MRKEGKEREVLSWLIKISNCSHAACVTKNRYLHMHTIVSTNLIVHH